MRVKKIFLFVLLCLGMFCSCKMNDNTVKIGLLNPMSGELSSYGEKVKRGVDLAVDDVNAKGLLGGRKIEIIMEDSQGDSKISLDAVQKMINIDKIQYIIGGISSNVTLSVLPYTESRNVFLFSPGAATPKLSNMSKLFARNWPSNDEEANSAAHFIYSSLEAKKASIVYVNNDWGLGLYNSFVKTYRELGGEITAAYIYPYEEIDFRNIISKLKKDMGEVMYLAGNQREMGMFVKQLRESKIEVQVVANTSFLEKDCLNLAGDASNGVIVPTPGYNPSDTVRSIADFNDKFVAAYNYQPSLVDANGYDAVMLLVDAINIMGEEPQKVAEYIRNKKGYYGAGGLLNFHNGDVVVNTEFKMIEEGKVVSFKKGI